MGPCLGERVDAALLAAVGDTLQHAAHEAIGRLHRLALLGQRNGGGDIARAKTAFSMLYILGGLMGRPLAGAAMDAVGDPGLGWTLAVFYAFAGLCALLAFRRRR